MKSPASAAPDLASSPSLATDPCAWLAQLVEWDSHATAAAIDAICAARNHLEHGGHSAEAAPVIKATEIMTHIVCARRIWLSRLGLGDPPAEIFPAAWPMDRVQAEVLRPITLAESAAPRSPPPPAAADRLLARDIRALRKSRGLTLAEIGGRLRRSVGWLSQV